ncbi:MAG: Hint domain-containing protein [Pseudomonadota bacterium]
MGYNIADVSGNSTGFTGDFTFTADLTDPAVTSVTGDFDAFLLTNVNVGEATDGYAFGPLSTSDYGSLSVNTVTGTFTFTIDRAAVLASGSDQVVSFTVTGTSGGLTDTDTVFIDLLICVAEGTLIQTDRGERPVETLTEGDRVWTVDDGYQPVRWIGARHVDRQTLASDPQLRPVVIAPDALGPGVPRRTLTVSPQHRILMAGWDIELMFGDAEVLIPAKALVDGGRVRVATPPDGVTYYHLLFDRHQVIATEGALTESFHPASYAASELGDAAKVELHRLFPALTAGTYGTTARPALRPWEGRTLTLRQAPDLAAAS